MNQTTILQYLKNTTQKIRDWIADALAIMPPKGNMTPGRLALTWVTKNEAVDAFARVLKTSVTRDAMRILVTIPRVDCSYVFFCHLMSHHFLPASPAVPAHDPSG